MKRIEVFIVFISCWVLFLLSGCDTEAEMMDDVAGYVQFNGIRVVFQADVADTYQFTLDGDSIKTAETCFFPRNKRTATLRAFKNNEPMSVLEEEILLEDGKGVELVQMPGAGISVLQSQGEEQDPSSENKVKLRLFYSNMEGWGKSIKVDVWIRAGRRGTPTFTNVSFELEEGVLSDYKEIDMNHLFPAETGSPMFISDIWDNETGELLVDHTIGMISGQITLGYMFDGNYDPSLGFKNDYKLITCQLYQDAYDLSSYYFSFIPELSVIW